MSESRVFQLERFYVGTLVDASNRVSSTPGIIARTPGITPGHAAECLRLAPLAPVPREAASADMPAAFGLFRGEQSDFILAKAQLNDAGRPQILFILVPVAPLRWLGGNVLALRSLALMEMPSFTAFKPNLLPFELRDPVPPSDEEQADALLDLLQYCQDAFKHVEGILAGLVQGWPIAVVNSPASLEQRMRFVQGLLSLLPVPARVGITYATHVQDAAACPAQVKFLSSDAEPPQHLVYDWGRGKLLTPPPEDSYSHYMIAQMRLDPSLVVEQTAQLSRTTAWRALKREDLGHALAWVSRRAAIDQTVRDGQPADRATVAAILREDPTLSDDLRPIYSRHLLAFSLALDDLPSADVIPAISASNPDLAQSVADQLRAAVQGGQARRVYSLLERWLLQVPDTAPGQWQGLIQEAAHCAVIELLEQQQPAQAVELLQAIRSTPPALALREALPDMAAAIQPFARRDASLAAALFELAVDSLPAGEFYRLMDDPEFTRQLPAPLQEALQYLQREPRHPAPPHVLDTGARSCGESQQVLVLARLVEWAMYLRRPELVDTAALQALLVIVRSPRAERFERVIQHVVEDYSQSSLLQVLEPPGPRLLVQLLLHSSQFDQAVRLLEFYQDVVYRPERLDEFCQLAGEAFAQTPLAAETLDEALGHLESSQLRPEPRAMIYCGVLNRGEWSGDRDYAARRLTSMIFNDNYLVQVIGHENGLKLLHFYARQQSALDTLRVAAALVDQSLALGVEGAPVVERMWPALTWNAEVTEAALELLRRYVRAIPLEDVPALIETFEQRLGAPVGEALRATWLMRQVMGESGLMRFADDVHLATHLLVDIATAYESRKEPPPNHRLRRDLDTMTGGLSEHERKQVAANTLLLTQQVYDLGRERAAKRGRSIDDDLIREQATPQSGVDLLRFIGGHFARHEALPLNLQREAMAHILGSRSAAMLLRETDAITRLLAGLHAAFQVHSADRVTARALAAELDSLWGTVSLYHQRRIQDDFAADCQHLADVISLISDEANERILSDGGPGRQLVTGQRQPHTAAEALRWIYGYFARKHTRI